MTALPPLASRQFDNLQPAVPSETTGKASWQSSAFICLIFIDVEYHYIPCISIPPIYSWTPAYVATIDCRMYPTLNNFYPMSPLSENRLYEFCIPLSYDMCIKAKPLLASIIQHLDTILTEKCRWYLSSTTVLGSTYDWNYKTFLYRPVLIISHACIS